jgi:hypothetical protein
MKELKAAVAALVSYLIIRGKADTDRLLVGQRGGLGCGAVEIILLASMVIELVSRSHHI